MRRRAGRGHAFLTRVLLLPPALPASAAHPKALHPVPIVETFQGCPPRRIGDSDLNLDYMENHGDEPTTAERWSIRYGDELGQREYDAGNSSEMEARAI